MGEERECLFSQRLCPRQLLLLPRSYQWADVEYCIGQSYWASGYATEALHAVIEYAFEHIRLNRVQAFHRSKNPASGKVLEKAGMQCEGTLKQYLIHNDVFDDCIMYAAIRDEWNDRWHC